MSIFTGKNGYNSISEWTSRSEQALRTRGELYTYDLGLEDKSPCVDWIKNTLLRYGSKPDVLEVGSGFGKWAKVLDGYYNTFTGLEAVAARVEHSQKLYGSPTVTFENLSPDTNLGRLFEVILSVTVIQHVTVPEAVGLLRVIERHLAPGGQALLAEWRIWDISVGAAEERYAEPSCSAHMIPKPLGYLQNAVPELSWSGDNGCFVLRRKS
jgi:2-polyprenyl-3-methyl-5-hydroxy-6-metoxy-1,4-benzoquinol methylase